MYNNLVILILGIKQERHHYSSQQNQAIIEANEPCEI